MEEYLREKVPTTAKEAAIEAIKIIQVARNDKIRRDGKNLVIQQLFEMGFNATAARGATKVSSKMLQQVLWRTMALMKPLDFTIHAAGAEEWQEKLVTDGVSTVMDKGGYVRALRDKEGLFQKSLMWGDGWALVGTNPNKASKIPIVFNPVSNTNIYFDQYATVMRGAWGRQVRKCVVIFSYSFETAKKLYPKLKSPGRIPRDMNYFKELERTFLQTTQITGDDICEIAYLYDIDSNIYGVFGGSGLQDLEFKKGDDYPFVKDGESYIPVLAQMCMPSSEGIYNHGLFDSIYDLAVMSAQLMNMAIGHAEDSVYPITMVNVPQGEASKFFNKLRTAHEMRAAGNKGYVAMEYSSTNPNTQANASSLLTPSIYQEWQSLYEVFTREVARLGIHLDDVDRGTSVTASQIIAEEEAKNSFAKQVMEYNATESQFAVELAMDFIKSFVDPSDDTPLNMTTTYVVNGQKMRGDKITLGAVSELLRQKNFFVKVNARSGSVPSNVFQQAQITRLLQVSTPGSPAFYSLVGELAHLNDRDLDAEDFGAQPQGMQQLSVEGVTDVDQLPINPRQKQFAPQGSTAGAPIG